MIGEGRGHKVKDRRPKEKKENDAHLNLKPMMQAEPFSGFNIFWMHNQNDFGRFGMILLSRVMSF